MKQFSARSTMAATCASFFALGLVTAALGPALPDLAANAAASLAAIGAVFTALFLGGLVAQLVAGPLNDRIGQRPVLLAGLALLALGVLALTISRTLPLALASAFVAGLGHGAVDVSTNVLIAEVFAARGAAALNLLNVFFGLGAFAGPAIAGLTLRLWGTALPALWLGAALLLLYVAFVPLLAVPPLLWAIGVLLLVYVGIENGIGGWTTTYLERTTTIDTSAAALVTAGFWLALTVGRVAGALLGTRVAASTLLLVSLAGALAGGLLLALGTGSAAPTIAAVALLGLFFGPIFPTALAIVTATFRRAPGMAASVAVAMGSVGGMLIPWLQGALLERGGPSASVMLVAGGTLAMLAIEAGRRLFASRQQAANSRQPAVGVADPADS